MMSSRQKTVFAALFLALLFAVPIFTLLLPSDEYSELEKRVLSGAPAFSLESGAFSRDTESYLADRLPLRETLIGIDADRKLLSGLQITGEVFLENGALNERPLRRDDEKLKQNLDRLGAFGETLGKRVLLLTPPSAGAVRAAETGRSLLPYEDKDILSIIRSSQAVDLIPLYDDFAQGGGDLFYRTDPHWNARGAYLAYTRLCDALSLSPLPISAFSATASGDFYGTCFSRAALWRFPPDTLDMWDAGQQISVLLDGNAPTDSLFFTDHLSSSDQYPVFLDGNHGLTVIQNASCDNGRRLLVLKDSFGNSLAPLLTAHYEEIVLIDLRAYRLPVSDLCKEKPFDDILAVYSLERLTHDGNFAWLR